MMPTFIIGGSVSSGTSFLSSVLLQHPEVYLPQPLRPEPNFFYKSWEHAKGIEYYERKWFASVDGKKAIGERSSLYLSDFTDGTVAKRIHQANPNVKLIFMLRDPVERAYANYRFTALSGLEWLSFEEALEREEERIVAMKGVWREIQPYAYFRRGLYARQLQPYLDLFQRENVLILSSDQVRANQDRFLRKLFVFIGVNPDVEVHAGTFTSPDVRNLALQRWLRKWNPQRLDEAVEKARENTPRSLFDRFVAWNFASQKPRMNSDTEKRLLERYRPYNDQLRDIVDWNIEDWNNR